MIRKRKKKNKLRGNRTHGRGNTKNKRGKGATGGRGRAGSHKHKFSKYWKEMSREAKKGFYNKTRKDFEVINVDELDRAIVDENFRKGKSLQNVIEKKDAETVVDFKDKNMCKILGRGNMTRKIVLRNAVVSESAKKKIEAVGGRIE